MLDQLDELYREVILDHFKSPTHSGELPEAQVKVDGANPLCGDELTFYLKTDGGRLARVRFHGKGCAISQAAASMLAGQLEGQTVDEARRVIEAMKGLMQGREPPESLDLGDLEALAGVRKFPVRVKFAALSRNVVEQGLQQVIGVR
ncbi:MAG: SUF system NifU family Fe-S cluster assembly protein [Candidatus Omnitrophica bacterium]|nr:SUF system NifU family Fe-S cluster assembly protein [Candidatus Omnitrophota bacterium]